jgi:PLP dependent protein
LAGFDSDNFTNFTLNRDWMEIGENIRNIKNSLPGHVKLVAVSKTKPVELIKEVYDSGHKIFGENKALELAKKYELLPKDIEWHFIGHLQTNKVKYIAPFVCLIHSVDSLKLLIEINKEAQKAGRIIPCLLQFYIADESTKFGLSVEEAGELLQSDEFKLLKNIRIDGVMGLATFTDNLIQVKDEFSMLKNIFDMLKSDYFSGAEYFTEISMGMSNDYEQAIESGSTIVRVGSRIFGERK